MSTYQDMHGLVHLAAITSRQKSTSATPEQVDLVVELQEVSRVITEYCREVLQGEGHRWAEVADILGAASKACRRQTVMELNDAGDAGGR